MFKEKFEDYWADMAKKSRNELMEKIESQHPDLIRQINRVEWVFRNKLTHLTWEDGSPITERDYTSAELARLLDPPFAPINTLSQKGIEEQQQFSLYISQDPVLWSKHILGVEPRVYQILMLRDPSSRVLYRLGRRMGKCLDVDTPIPTPGGWKTMADIEVGQHVYDDKGRVCNVVFATDYKYDHNCYEVHFNDGYSIVADEDHLWGVGSETLTTLQIKNGLEAGEEYVIEGGVPAVYTGHSSVVYHKHEIVDIKPIETRPVKCIKVDSESNLFLAGENCVPTHNTYTLAIKLLHHAWTTSNGGILVLAPMSSQVNLIYEAAKTLASYSDLVDNSLVRTRQTPYAEIQFSTGSAARFFTTGMKSGGKCLSPDHDVLTANGWRSIMNVHEGDRVLSWDGKNYVWKPVTNTTSYHHEGDMVWVNRPDLSFFATPNHKFPVWWNEQWQMVEAQDLAYEDQIPIAAPPEIYDPEFVGIILKFLNADEIPEHHFTLTVNSRKDAEFLQLCATAIGRYAKLRPWMDGWSVEVSENTFQSVKAGKTKTAYYQGPVFCIEVADTHTFVARHNGTVFVTGNSDVARGQEAELIILDEMDYMGEDDLVAIYAILMPTREGEPEKSLIAASTPSGKHGKFREWATNSAHGFSAHWYPSYANILMDAKTEAEQRAEYTDNEIRREIEADWGEPAEGVYAKRHLDRAFLDRPWDYVAQRRHPDSDYYIGVDWDTVAAGPNIVVLEVLPEDYDEDPRLTGMLRVSFREEVDNQQDAPLTAATERIIELNQIFAPARIMIDKGYGTVQHEQLLQYGSDHPETKLKERLTGVSFSEKIMMKDPSTREDIKKDVKPYMVNVLQHLFEKDMIFFPNTDLDLYNQLLGYIVLRVNESGRPIYEGLHSDHAHDALALACLGYNYDHDKLHAKPNVARRAAIARTANSEPDDPDYPSQSRVAPMLANYGRRKQRAGAGVRKRKKF